MKISAAPEFELLTRNFGDEFATAQDLVDILMAGIADAGFPVRYSHDRFYRGRSHIFIDRIPPDLLAFLHENRLEYGLVVTEEVSPDGAFGWSSIEHGGSPYDVGRAYIPQVEGAKFVWCLLEASLPFCRKYNPRSEVVRFGFSPRLLPRFEVAWSRRDIQVVATGPMTERRAQIYNALIGRGAGVQHIGHPLAGWRRDNYLVRALLHAAPHRTDAHVRFVNPQRVIQSVMYRVPLAIELHDPERHEMAAYCAAFAPEEFVDGVIRMLSDPVALRLEAERNYVRLADERPMGSAFRNLIETTFAA